MPSGYEAGRWPAAKAVWVVRGARAHLSNPKIQDRQEPLRSKAEENEDQVYVLDTVRIQWWGLIAVLSEPELDFFSLDWDHKM